MIMRSQNLKHLRKKRSEKWKNCHWTFRRYVICGKPIFFYAFFTLQGIKKPGQSQVFCIKG